MPGSAAFRTLKQTARNLVTDPPRSVRELPGRTIRTAVIGVGRGLLLADRVREEYKEVRRDGVGATVTKLRTSGVSAFGRGPTAGTAAEPATEPHPERTAEPAPEPRAKPAPESRAKPAPEPAKSAAAQEPSAAAGTDLPVPNYDDLSVASLRARLRNLTVAQVEHLRDYERAHADRQSVVTMYDNRIAKLRAEGSDS